MRVFSRSSSSLIVTITLLGTSALMVLLVVLVTGGFVIDAGPLHFSSRRPLPPLAVAVIAWGAAVGVGGRSGIVKALTRLGLGLDRHAPVLAILIVAATIGTGVAFSTFAASSSDASGYVSQAALLASARVSFDEPLARLVPWTDATSTFSPLGYRPGIVPGEVVPTYPPGLPLTMAAASVAGGEWMTFAVVPVLGGLAVLCTYLLGVQLHSRRAGLTAALLLATSPVFLFQLVQPMSDVPAVAWWTLAIALAFSPLPGAPVASGAVAGFALLARPNLVPLVAPLAIFVCGWPVTPGTTSPVGTSLRARAARAVAFASGLVPAAGAMGLLQWRLYGNPLASGHGAVSDFFALSNVWPNIGAYLSRILRGEPAVLVLALLAVLVIAVTRGRREAQLPLSPSARAATLFGTTVVICYLSYVAFPDWSYLRFLLPAFPLAFVAVGACVARATSTVPRPIEALVLLLLLTIAASVNVVIARREQAFALRDFEARYRSAGRYIDSVLPPEAVIFAVQESGSARYYARPIVRWDLLPVELDDAVAALTAIHRRPVFLIEEWEIPDIQKRFPSSRLARLDWPARADIGTNVRVLLFDPADRDQPASLIPTDRFR